MNRNYEQTKDYLLKSDAEFKRFYEEHKTIHKTIENIEDTLILTESDKIKVKSLKKQKLLLKDKMEEIIYSHIR